MPTALISGASRGLGLALTRAFRGIGASVFSGARCAVGPDDVELDVRSISSCENAVSRVVAIDGGIDFLINNAGVHLGGPVASLNQDAFKQTLDVNLLGAWRLTKAAVPHMRRGGTIAMISSLSGLVGLPGDGAYAASKFALEGLSQSLAAELAPAGIRVIVFQPGRVATEFGGATDGLAPEIAAQEIVDAIMCSETPFRNPIGADATHVFERLGVDRGERTEALVRAVAGCDWQPRSGD
jgi:NAD(P)-dependent dehydrogenase (short-subunit alcohol dehydrogenase family)